MHTGQSHSYFAGNDLAIAGLTTDHPDLNRRVCVGSQVDDGFLMETVLGGGARAPMQPRVQHVAGLMAEKAILVFGVAGAYAIAADARLATYVRCSDRLRANGVDEIWCIAINNPYVLGIWGIDAGAGTKVRLMSDRHGAWTQSLGLTSDEYASGIQVCATAYSMFVANGVVRMVSAVHPEHRSDEILETLLATSFHGKARDDAVVCHG